MKLPIAIKYYHPQLAIGLENVKNAWLISANAEPVKLKTDMHQGQLSYRFPRTGKRISYRTLKKGLIKKSMTIYLNCNLLPF